MKYDNKTGKIEGRWSDGNGNGNFEGNSKGVKKKTIRSKEDKILGGQDDGFPFHSVQNARS